MLNKLFIKKTSVFVILFFSFFMFQTNFNYSNEEDILKKARLFIIEGNLTDAISELTKIIGRLKNIDEKKKKVAEAYYLLAKVHYDGGDDKKFEENVKMAYTVYPDFNTNESNFEIKDRVEQIKNSIVLKDKSDKKIEKQNKPIPDEKKIETKKVIVKQGIEKKKKKKFPILLIVAGVAAIVAAVVLLGGEKDSSLTPTPPPDNLVAQEVYDSIEWINIPAGEFQMGDNFNEGESDERPVHSVFLDTYFISKFEINFEKYDKFCDDTGRDRLSDEGWYRAIPVINVSWNDAVAFCEWITSKTGHEVKLPTEAQWEKAARGTDQRRYPWGNSDPSSVICNYNNNQGRPLPGNNYHNGFSPYGLSDMAGNVSEWCSDRYDSNYYNYSSYTNPEGASTGTDHVLRGGAWNDPAFGIRSARRYHKEPGFSSNNLGFRVIRK